MMCVTCDRDASQLRAYKASRHIQRNNNYPTTTTTTTTTTAAAATTCSVFSAHAVRLSFEKSGRAQAHCKRGGAESGVECDV